MASEAEILEAARAVREAAARERAAAAAEVHAELERASAELDHSNAVDALWAARCRLYELAGGQPVPAHQED